MPGLTGDDASAPDASQAPAPQAPSAPVTPAAPVDAAGKPSLWRNILSGALSGLKGAGEGLAMGGIPGAIEGAVSPGDAATKWQQRKDVAAAKVAQAQAQVPHTQSETELANAQAAGVRQKTAGVPQEQADTSAASQASTQGAQLDNAGKAQQLGLTAQFSDAQAAGAMGRAAANDANLQKLPADAKVQQNSINSGLNDFMKSLGVPPIAISDDSHDAVVSALNQIGNTQGTIPHMINLTVNGQHIGYDLNQLAGSPQSLTMINSQRKSSLQPELTPAQWAQTPQAAKTQMIEKATSFFSPPVAKNAEDAQGTYLQYKSTLDALKASPNADPEALKSLSALTDRLKTIADSRSQAQTDQKAKDAFAEASAKSNVETMAQKRQDAQPWVLGATADEKKKAELAENIAENTNQAAKILVARKNDLFGPLAGRFTSTEQMIGNNDPDISKLGTVVHNIAMANSGVHGFRSQEGVKATENLILNNFKNGPQAVAGALRGLTNSTQTFIDNARKDTYKTHSKQGGALKGMEQ